MNANQSPAHFPKEGKGALRILTTLLAADAGTARVAGFDVVREANAVRGAISVTAQEAAVDGLLTGRGHPGREGSSQGVVTKATHEGREDRTSKIPRRP